LLRRWGCGHKSSWKAKAQLGLTIGLRLFGTEHQGAWSCCGAVHPQVATCARLDGWRQLVMQPRTAGLAAIRPAYRNPGSARSDDVRAHGAKLAKRRGAVDRDCHRLGRASFRHWLSVANSATVVRRAPLECAGGRRSRMGCTSPASRRAPCSDCERLSPEPASGRSTRPTRREDVQTASTEALAAGFRPLSTGYDNSHNRPVATAGCTACWLASNRATRSSLAGDSPRPRHCRRRRRHDRWTNRPRRRDNARAGRSGRIATPQRHRAREVPDGLREQYSHHDHRVHD